MSAVDDARRHELSVNLAAVRKGIEVACSAVGRAADTVTLVAVTKTHPATDVLHLAAIGVRDIGENRDQEAAAKAAEVAAAGQSVRWHFVGQLQRNKCRSVVGYAELVHSVDRVGLVTALDEAALRHRERPLDVLVQVSIDGDPHRGGAVAPIGASSEGMAAATAGVAAAARGVATAARGVATAAAGAVTRADADADLDHVLASVAQARGLVLRGLMAVAPLEWEPRRAYARLAEIAAYVRRAYPTASLLSAGMSDDMEEAIKHGATHVRVGTALLGNRPRLM